MKTMKTIAVGLVGLGMSAAASAAPVETWTDVFDPVDVYFSPAGKGGVQTYTYVHDITDDGFVVGADTVGSFVLTIELYDDAIINGSDGAERVMIDLPGTAADINNIEIDYFDVVTGFSVEGIAQLNSSGLLEVILNQKTNDFYFGSSTLVATAVPEPATALLLGAGAGLLGFAARKKRAQAQAA